MIYYNIAILYKDRSLIDEAMEALDKALAIDAECEQSHTLYAEIAYDGRLFEKAIEHLTFITELNPDDEESARRLAISYQRTGQLDRAIQRYISILANDNSNVRTHLNLANAYRALAFENPNEAMRYNRLALQSFVEALRITPDNPRIEISISDVHLALNDFVSSERFANAARQRQGDLYEAYIILGSIAQRRGIDRYNNFVELQTTTDSGNLFGRELDDTIAQRDRAKSEAHNLFNQADRMFKDALERTDNDRIRTEINQRIRDNQQYINLTRPDFFN